MTDDERDAWNIIERETGWRFGEEYNGGMDTRTIAIAAAFILALVLLLLLA